MCLRVVRTTMEVEIALIWSLYLGASDYDVDHVPLVIYKNGIDRYARSSSAQIVCTFSVPL